jgi:ABC-type Fe3+-hydroxamate transport system substrate-binding protein
MVILDQIGRELVFDSSSKIRRVVSLVPSITELAYDLGFDVVGRTKFCVHPKNIENCEVIGGTKNIKVDKVIAIRPDLIIANKEENTKETVEQLIKSGLEVYVSDVSTLEDNFELIDHLGRIGGYQQNAYELAKAIKKGFTPFRVRKSKSAPKLLYLIWKEPYMAAGTDTFISDIITRIGGVNVLACKGEAHRRYPSMDISKIIELNPNYILLSSEPFPFKKQHADQLEDLTGIKTMLVDGESFSWYGSRMAKSFEYLQRISRLLHIEVEK